MTPTHIHDLRVSLSLTQSEFAELLMVTRETVSRWESARDCSKIHPAHLHAIQEMMNAAVRSRRRPRLPATMVTTDG